MTKTDDTSSAGTKSVGTKSVGIESLVADSAAAFLLLSRIPVFWHKFAEADEPDFRAALWAFPLVGLVIGGAGGGVMLGANWLGLPPIISATLALAAMLLLAGGMHEDGLADMLDGFGGGGDAKTKAKIMHDSHIGSYGVLGLCLSTVARIGLLLAVQDSVTGWQIIPILAIAGAGSRFQVLAILRLYPLSQFAKLALLTGKPDVLRGLLGLALWVVPMLMFLPPIGFSAALILTTALSLWLGRLAMSQIGGLNGDVMGASIVLAEISILTCIIAALGAAS